MNRLGICGRPSSAFENIKSDPFQIRAAWHKQRVLILQVFFSHLYKYIVNCSISRIQVARYVVAFALHNMNSISPPGRFGNRGMNQPVVDLRTQRCYITAQNHGFAVDQTTLPQHWVPLMDNCYWLRWNVLFSFFKLFIRRHISFFLSCTERPHDL